MKIWKRPISKRRNWKYKWKQKCRVKIGRRKKQKEQNASEDCKWEYKVDVELV